jgi:hypothetical protein
MDTTSLISLIYLIIGSTLGIFSFIKMIYDYRKEQMKWYSAPIESDFERKNDGNITIKLEFMLTNEGRRNMSVPIAVLSIFSDPQFLRFGFGDTCKLQDFKPINLRGGETKPVILNFVSLRPPNIKNIKDVKREELLNHGINAKLELMDNERHTAKAQLFIYEGGFLKFFEEHRELLVSPENLQIIMERMHKEVLRYS